VQRVRLVKQCARRARDLWVREQSGGDGREGDEEGWAEVGAQTGDEAGKDGERDFLFDVEVDA
jgi:hypothetical protein